MSHIDLEQDGKEAATQVASRQTTRHADWRGRLAEGFLLGAVLGYAIFELGPAIGLQVADAFLLPALMGALLALTRVRAILRALTALFLFGVMIVGYTPLAPWLMNGIVRVDTLRSAPAVVVLSSSVFSDKSLTSQAQERAIKGYELLRQGYAPILVLTQSTNEFGSQIDTVKRQMKALRMEYPVENTGPVQNTHDEALAVVALARRRGWKEVLLVTHPWHMRRAAAVFEKAGIAVIGAPCHEGSFNMHGLNNPRARFRAFGAWLHEAVGYRVYRWRGWI